MLPQMQISWELEGYRCFLLRVMALNPEPLLHRIELDVEGTQVSVSKQWLVDMVNRSVSKSTMTEAQQACEHYHATLAKLQVC